MTDIITGLQQSMTINSYINSLTVEDTPVYNCSSPVPCNSIAAKIAKQALVHSTCLILDRITGSNRNGNFNTLIV